MASTKFLGTSDEVTTCDCCGRKDLKSTDRFRQITKLGGYTAARDAYLSAV
jgi:hypothetical protein